MSVTSRATHHSRQRNIAFDDAPQLDTSTPNHGAVASRSCAFGRPMMATLMQPKPRPPTSARPSMGSALSPSVGQIGNRIERHRGEYHPHDALLASHIIWHGTRQSGLLGRLAGDS